MGMNLDDDKGPDANGDVRHICLRLPDERMKLAAARIEGMERNNGSGIKRCDEDCLWRQLTLQNNGWWFGTEMQTFFFGLLPFSRHYRLPGATRRRLAVASPDCGVCLVPDALAWLAGLCSIQPKVPSTLLGLVRVELYCRASLVVGK